MGETRAAMFPARLGTAWALKEIFKATPLISRFLSLNGTPVAKGCLGPFQCSLYLLLLTSPLGQTQCLFSGWFGEGWGLGRVVEGGVGAGVWGTFVLIDAVL